MKKEIELIISQSKEAIENVSFLSELIEQSALEIIKSLKKGNKILICGNGGSAAESQHFAAELVGRFEKERLAIPCIALTTDTSNITSISNDSSFEYVFSRQIEALGNKDDILIILTSSDFNEDGHSLNLKNAIIKAKEKNMKTILLGSIKSEKIGALVDIAIKVNHKNTARIQEGHLLILHILAKLIEDSFSENN